MQLQETHERYWLILANNSGFQFSRRFNVCPLHVRSKSWSDSQVDPWFDAMGSTVCGRHRCSSTLCWRRKDILLLLQWKFYQYFSRVSINPLFFEVSRCLLRYQDHGWARTISLNYLWYSDRMRICLLLPHKFSMMSVTRCRIIGLHSSKILTMVHGTQAGHCTRLVAHCCILRRMTQIELSSSI